VVSPESQCVKCGFKRNPYRILVGELEGRNHMAELGIEKGIILKCILNSMGCHSLNLSASG